jgi:acetyltransferase
MFVEGFRDGRRFVEVARRITATKPVVVLKAGKASAGARAAASHTGSVAGRHAAVSAALERAGVIEARTSDEMFDTLAMITAPGEVPAGNRVAVLTISGGPGVLAADAAEAAGLSLASPSPATVDQVRELAPAFAATGNPIDLTPQCPPGNFPAAIAAVYDDPAFDAVLVIDCGLDIPELGTGVVDAVRATGKPTAAFVLDVPEIQRAFDAAAIPCFGAPERAAQALANRIRPCAR